MEPETQSILTTLRQDGDPRGSSLGGGRGTAGCQTVTGRPPALFQWEVRPFYQGISFGLAWCLILLQSNCRRRLWWVTGSVGAVCAWGTYLLSMAIRQERLSENPEIEILGGVLPQRLYICGAGGHIRDQLAAPAVRDRMVRAQWL